MSSPQAILAHLREGRDELVREVTRLTTAIAELDAVIDRVGGPGATEGLSSPTPVPGSGASSAAQVQVETEPTSAPQPSARRRPAKQSVPAKRSAAPARNTPGRAATRTAAKKAASAAPAGPRGTSRAGSGGGQKSIRVHVLEMLGAENRDFGLAEIIDRIHGQGIEAHDDAVRSITIKLMKDGRVERVGRGQYRLARRSRSSARQAGGEASGADPAPATSTATEDAPSAPEVDPAAAAPPADAPAAEQTGDETADRTAAQSADPSAPADDPQPGGTADSAASAVLPDDAYTPPLNLAEPWQAR